MGELKFKSYYKQSINQWNTPSSQLSIIKDVVPVVGMSFILFYGCFIGNSMLIMAITGVISMYLLFCKYVLLLPSMLYFCSFAFMFQAGDFMLYEFLCIVFMFRVFINEKRNQVFLLLWSIIYFITHIISSSITFSNIIPILYIITLLFACVAYRTELYNTCVIMYLLGVFVTSLLGFLKPFSPYLIELLSEDLAEGMNADFIVRFSGLSYDPNFYTISVIISIMLLLFSRYKKTWLTLLLALAYICLGAVTYSKSYILSLLVIFLLYFLDGKSSVSKKVLLFIAFGYLVSTPFFDGIVYVFKERFSGNSNFNDLTTGRYDLWVLYWAHIGDTLKTLFLGHGFSSLQDYKAAHNTYIEILFNFGLIGFLVDYLFIKKSYSLINKQKMTMVHLGIISIVFMLFFNLSAYTFPSLWMCLFMVFILISKRSSYNEVKFES